MPVPLYLDVHLPLAIAVMSEDWQRQGRGFAGLFYGHQLAANIGRWVADLELIAKASEASEWANAVQHLSL